MSSGQSSRLFKSSTWIFEMQMLSMTPVLVFERVCLRCKQIHAKISQRGGCFLGGEEGVIMVIFEDN